MARIPDLAIHHAGIPTAFFDWALLWYPEHQLTRSPSTRWPSWSWSGWHGRVCSSIVGYGEQSSLLRFSWLHWRHCQAREVASGSFNLLSESHRAFASVRKIGSQRLSHTLTPFWPSAATTKPTVDESSRQLQVNDADAPIPDLYTALQLSPNILMCLTWSITSILKQEDSSSDGKTWYRICTNDGTSYGRLQAHAAGLPCEGDAKYEVIALSPGHSNALSVKWWNLQVWYPKGLVECDKGDGDLFHVLGVHYPRHPRLAERLGVGIVSKKGFFDQEPAWKEVWLG